MDVKDPTGKDSEGTEEYGRENLYCLREPLNITNRLLSETWMLKVQLMGVQKKMRTMLMETRERGSFLPIQWQKA